ncbi:MULTISPECIES: HPF/RaiA family ribosome-associated protein [Maribacter]|uniref:HPF/RaiA family ribosome-associated protein n=1 Tax=Maribacter flavus TaxID=1658664 RepID=A0A5B2TZG5_9FLAO|nr:MULTISPECIES: HPF/RaiA family ribosome-associated protein [Maribacter]KAA2219794.1 HPF/RaiA family ribosome-associated protein [Maribacter flavus]MDC6405294.1 HPF/RaiA family ribosome-associated protein [Maribacter sp. PR66]MEE1971897.1 HPF/RaiA family ribosome-associated protein [Maribacter flavus]
MTVNIQYIDMPESESLSEIVTRNLKKLAHKYQFIIRGDIYFKLGQCKDGNDKICEIQLSAPGPRIFAKSIEDNFEKSAAETIGDLERQLRKRKEKFNKRKKAI